MSIYMHYHFQEDVRKHFVCHFRETESILDIFFIIENINSDSDTFREKRQHKTRLLPYLSKNLPVTRNESKQSL